MDKVQNMTEAMVQQDVVLFEEVACVGGKIIGIATLNSEKSLNALSLPMVELLLPQLQLWKDDPQIVMVLLQGAGDKAFVAGADIKEFSDYSGKQGEDLAKHGQDLVFNAIENSSKPFIAAINGFALGGGLELAMACHIRIASENAKLGLPEVTLGVIPGYGGTQRLPQLVGKGRAMEMIMTATMIDAETAKNYGLVNHVVPQAELLAFAKSIASKITNNSSVAISNAIEAVNANFKNGINGYEVEIRNFGKSFGTEDFKEGTTAFLEKRKAEFPGK